MDEEIKAQLVGILKDLRENASPVWQELLRQYSGHHFMMSMYNLVIIALSIGLFICVNKMLRNKNISFQSRSDDQQIIIAFGHIISIGGLITTSFLFFKNLSISYYPLHDVLASVLK